MNTNPEAYKTACKAHRLSQRLLTRAKKSLRILSHAALDGDYRADDACLALAARSVAKHERIESAARALALSYITA